MVDRSTWPDFVNGTTVITEFHLDDIADTLVATSGRVDNLEGIAAGTTDATATGVASVINDPGGVAQQAVDGRVTTRAAYISAADRGLPTDGTTDASPAIIQTVADARAAARAQLGTVTYGMPTIRIPKGQYKISSTILLSLISGATIEGAGMGVTVLYVPTGIPLFEIHRTNRLVIKNLTLVASTTGNNPGLVPYVDGLIEGSAGIYLHERNDDADQSNVSTILRFENIDFIGFHRAIHATGNQMGDNASWINCRLRDNFFGFDVQNGQCVNWRVYGGEILGFVIASESQYNERLASWSAAAVPVTAPAGQRQTPGDTASPIQNVTVRDGAACRSMAGGGITFSTVSFILKQTRLLFGGLPTVAATAADLYGTNQNVVPWAFEACSAEVRETTFNGASVPEPGDTYGYDRLALVRYERPHPAGGDKTLRAPVRFDKERITDTVPNWAAFHQTNGLQITVDGLYLLGSGAPTARLVSHITPGGSITADMGRFVARDSSPLVRVRVGKNADGTDWAGITSYPELDHDITHEGLITGGSTLTFGRPVDRSLVPGVSRRRQVMYLAEIDNTLPKSGTVYRLRMPLNARVSRVRVVATPTSLAGVVPTFEFRNSAAAVLSSLTVDKTSVGTSTLTTSGAKRNGCRSPYEDLHVTLADGFLDVVQVTTAAQTTLAAVAGHIEVEFL